jgi:hypothetical protein
MKLTAADKGGQLLAGKLVTQHSPRICLSLSQQTGGHLPIFFLPGTPFQNLRFPVV